MTPADIVLLVVLGAILGLDVVSFPQAMLSRPLVAATLTGLLLGAPGRGLLLGAALECFALETLPVGASRYPEWGSSSVVGGALVAAPAAPASVERAGVAAGALIFAVLAALLWAWVGGWSMVQLRRLNAHWARQRHEAVAQGSRRVVIGLQLSGITADLVRGAVMTALGLLLFAPLSRAALARWSFSPAISQAVLATLAAIVAVGSVYKVFHAIPGTRWLLALGFALGLLLVGGLT